MNNSCFRLQISDSDCLEIFTDMMKSSKVEGSVARAAEVAELSEAVQGAEKILESAKNARPVKIPWGSGEAVQDLTKDALIARAKVEQKQSLYRIGTRGRSQTAEKAQFWSVEHPNTPWICVSIWYPSRQFISTELY